MKKIKLLILLLIVSIITTLATSLFLTFFSNNAKVVQTQEFEMTVNVKEDSIIGFNADPGNFHFGSMPRGAGGRRLLIISEVEQDVIVHINSLGEMATWVNYPNNFEVKSGENITISVSISVPQNVAVGNYTGIVMVSLISS